MKNTTDDVTVEAPTGILYESLARSSKQIKQDRGDAIAEDLEMAYSRKVEDLAREIKRLKRSQNNMFDFSPSNTQSLMMGKDVDADHILDNDVSILIKVREKEIKLELITSRYEELFGKTL